MVPQCAGVKRVKPTVRVEAFGIIVLYHMKRRRNNLDTKSKSILLQVAFKEATSTTMTQGIFNIDEVKNRTVEFYELLQQLHDELEIETAWQKRATNNTSGSRGGSTNDFGIEFEVDGVLWRDFRTAKDAGQVKANFPDFKSENNDSLWLTDKEGNPVPEAENLRKLADVAV